MRAKLESRPNPKYYVVGGTLSISALSYVQRAADQELLENLRDREYCYILTTRQMGKSSLMVRTAAKLQESDICTAVIDLTAFALEGIKPESWYMGQIRQVVKQLCPSFDYINWWKGHAHLSETHRYVMFLSEVLLERVSAPVVLFIDEIDSTLQLPFGDDFFAAIRSLYNSRASQQDLQRLTFTLLGVASPSELIRDAKRTPFNIGRRVELGDFTFEEAQGLAVGLAPTFELAVEILRQIILWTGGHPYLTQKTCSAVAEWAKKSWDTSRAENIVEELVRETFFTERGQNTDDNLQFVRDRLLRAPRSLQLLDLYERVRQGDAPVYDDQRDPDRTALKLSGIVKADDARALQVRNRIYHQVFNISWIRAFSTPDSTSPAVDFEGVAPGGGFVQFSTPDSTSPAVDFTYDVFVSHSRAERGWVRDELLPRLEGAGLRACLDWRDFRAGAPRAAEVERAATRSRHTLLVLTPAYLADEWAEFSDLLVQALDPAERQRRLVPLLKARCDLPLRIRHLTYVNFADPEEPEWAWVQLLTALGAPPLPVAPAEPAPAGWCLAHPYGMPPNFTGRAAERALLSEWLESDAIHPLLVLRALGGFGKSALAWHWLLHDVDAARWPRVVWWSFYDEPTFEEFLRQTLEYLGVAPLPAALRQQADVLLRLLHQPGTLLILDGFERALRAYGTLDAPYLGDEPPAPRDTEHGTRTTEHAPRTTQQDCLSPTSDHFLRAVSAMPGLRSKVLLTTRLRPRVLEGPGGDLLAGCREEELAHMQPPDAVAFLLAQGVRGSRAEIEAACAPYGYHPLSLRLLAGLIVRDPQQPGDVAAARHLDVSGEQVARQHHVLERAYESLATPGRRLLSRMACFRGPVGYKAIVAIGAGDLGAHGGDRQGHPYDVDADLRDLVARGLVHHDRQTNRYDLHPIVRRYAYDRLAGGEREEAHRTLRDYFAAVPPPERPRTLDDLAPVIELYHHTVRAGQYDEACTFFRDRLATTLFFQFGAYQLCLELLRALFPDGEDRLPRLKDESAQAWTLNALANSYSLSGQPRRAVSLFEASNVVDEKGGNKQGIAIGLGNLADDGLKIGALRAAEANLRRLIALGREVEDEFTEAVGHRELGRLLAYRGAWAEAEEELAASSRYPERTNDVQGLCLDEAYRALRTLLLARAVAAQDRAPLHAAALAAARRALDLADEWQKQVGRPNARDYVRAHWLLGAAHRANGDWDEADRHLAEALTRCRGINLVEMEADILLDLARLRADTALTPGPSPNGGRGGQALTPGPSPKAGRGEEALTPNPSLKAGRGEQALTPGPSPKAGRGESLDEALRLAEEALLIADRCGYVLQGAEAHLFLAHLALERGDREQAREHARQARELATCDGPPDYTYKVAYDEAGALLAQL